jgi:hypothetical protein
MIYLLLAIPLVFLFGVLFYVIFGFMWKTTVPLLDRRAALRDRRARAALGQPPKGEGESVQVERALDVDLPADQAYDRALKGVLAIPRRRHVVADREVSRIEARIGMSRNSFGEHVFVDIESTGGTTSHVAVKSIPRISTAVFDGGKNAWNVQTIARQFVEDFF